MKDMLMIVSAMMLAAAIVMVWHELWRSLAYVMFSPARSSEDKRKVWNVFSYIDPIGLLLFVTCQAGVSKPYQYKIRDKKTSAVIGLTGFISLLSLLCVCLFILNQMYGQEFNLFIITLIHFLPQFCITLIIINLFPISTFDGPLIISAFNASAYFKMIESDVILKYLLLFCIGFGFIRECSDWIYQLL